MAHFLLGVFASLLPEDWRRRWAWTSGEALTWPAVASGALECSVSLFFYVLRFLEFLQYRVGTVAEAAGKRPGGVEVLGVSAVQFGMGYASLVEYVFSPLSLLLAYFAIEGALRAYAAGITSEVVGTMPLFLAAAAEAGISRARIERAMGPRIPDQVFISPHAEYPLGITSCRPKKDWGPLITVEHEGELYEVAEQKRGTSPRPYIYLLRKIPPGKLIRNIHHFNPDEALTEKQRRALAERKGEEDRNG